MSGGLSAEIQLYAPLAAELVMSHQELGKELASWIASTRRAVLL
jgi:hypothetical protein